MFFLTCSWALITKWTQLLFRLPYWLPFLHTVAVVRNALILAAIWKKTFVKTPFHILLGGLAISDLCTGLISQPFIVAFTFIYLKQPKEVCDNPKLYFAVLGIGNGSATYLFTITVSFITLISIERWLHICRRSLVTAHRGYFTVATVWILPIPLVVVRVFGDVKAETCKRVECILRFASWYSFALSSLHSPISRFIKSSTITKFKFKNVRLLKILVNQQ